MVFSAGRSLGSPFFIIADNNLVPEENDLKEIPGLGIGKDISNNGHLVFCMTRLLCDKFYTWMLL